MANGWEIATKLARARLAQSVEHQTFKALAAKGSEGQGFKSLIGRKNFVAFDGSGLPLHLVRLH